MRKALQMAKPELFIKFYIENPEEAPFEFDSYFKILSYSFGLNLFVSIGE